MSELDEQTELQNQEENNSSEQPNEQEQESQPVTSPPSSVVTQEDFQRLSQLAARSIENENRMRAEIESLRNQTASKTTAPSYNFEELNTKMANGQFAEGVVELIRREQQEAMRPLLEQNASQQRADKLNNVVGQVISSHQYSSHLSQLAPQIAAEVKKNIGDIEPQFGMVKMIIDGLVGQALMANPNIFNQIPQTQSNNPAQVPTQRSPMPQQIPSTRPPSQGSKKDVLTESEKIVKNAIDPENKMTIEEFKQILSDPDTVIEHNLDYMLAVKAKGAK